MVSPRLHASAVVWRENGILIRGPSGSGKTTLARAFLAEGRRTGVFCRLVADDVVTVSAAGGRLIARPHLRIAGSIERRGIGVVAIEHEPACVVRLVLDLEAAPPRLPEADASSATILDVTLPRLALARDAPTTDNVYLVRDFIAAFRAGS